MYTLVIKNALIFDGTGSAPSTGDIAATGDTISLVSTCITAPADKVINAANLAVCPGFIDIHSHSDNTILRTPAANSKIMQGVTTEVVCNCGISPFPVNEERKSELTDYLELLEGYGEPGIDWPDFSGFTDSVARAGPAVNIAPLVGHGALRIAAMGTDNRAPSDREMTYMETMLDSCLRQGAWGMSTGLIYPPGSFAAIEEITALARIVKKHGALYSTHIRSETASLFDAINETITISEQSGAKTLISHLKAIGRRNWGSGVKLLELLAKARAEGLNIWADQYPYEATATALSALLPGWVQAGGIEQMLSNLESNACKPRLLPLVTAEIELRGGPEKILISSVHSAKNQKLCGHTLEYCAAIFRLTPAQTVVRLLVEERANVGAVYFSLDEKDLLAIMRDPEVLVGSDGYAFSQENHGEMLTHPRSYGTFPRVLGHYVRDKKVLPLETAIRKMTSLPAEVLDMKDRGQIKAGCAADLTVFDPGLINDTATFEKPHQYACGISYVIVNGQIAVDPAGLTTRRAGRLLKKI